ncbi:hypothetical protein B0T17DRAFT_519182 [Bombardia bombarda]|uniref:Uncharacterized protein n=1 Tax=Bombardia bombarda TaxID=252184 RepID=A0AA40CF40_9PEZI|nr:hypothetical protein B0T17DRAFT_519182 [Bombardia bombarda]
MHQQHDRHSLQSMSHAPNMLAMTSLASGRARGKIEPRCRRRPLTARLNYEKKPQDVHPVSLGQYESDKLYVHYEISSNIKHSLLRFPLTCRGLIAAAQTTIPQQSTAKCDDDFTSPETLTFSQVLSLFSGEDHDQDIISYQRIYLPFEDPRAVSLDERYLRELVAAIRHNSILFREQYPDRTLSMEVYITGTLWKEEYEFDVYQNSKRDHISVWSIMYEETEDPEEGGEIAQKFSLWHETWWWRNKTKNPAFLETGKGRQFDYDFVTTITTLTGVKDGVFVLKA